MFILMESSVLFSSQCTKPVLSYGLAKGFKHKQPHFREWEYSHMKVSAPLSVLITRGLNVHVRHLAKKKKKYHFLAFISFH